MTLTKDTLEVGKIYKFRTAFTKKASDLVIFLGIEVISCTSFKLMETETIQVFNLLFIDTNKRSSITVQDFNLIYFLEEL